MVYNLGSPGSDTRDEYRRLLEQPEQPAGIILVYYTNDIERACEGAGMPHGDLRPFEAALESCYTKPSVIAAHLSDLGRFVTFSHDHHIPLIVVAYPHLVDTERSHRLIQPVVRYLKDQEVPVLDVYRLLSGLAIRDRIVNNNDAHPSVLVNRLVAGALIPMIAAWPKETPAAR